MFNDMDGSNVYNRLEKLVKEKLLFSTVVLLYKSVWYTIQLAKWKLVLLAHRSKCQFKLTDFMLMQAVLYILYLLYLLSAFCFQRE